MRRPEQKALFIFLFIYRVPRGLSEHTHFLVSCRRIFRLGRTNGCRNWRMDSCRSRILVWGSFALGCFGGLLLLAVYGVLGLASLSHYLLAPLSDHTRTMNLTILFEVFAAMLVLIEAVRQMVRRILWRGFPDDA